MKEYSMENSDGIWQWSRDGKKLFRKSKFQAEQNPFENGDSTKSPVSVIRRHVSSSGSKSDHPHGDSGPGGPFLLWPLGFANENSVEDPNKLYEKKQPFKSRVSRRGQKTVLQQKSFFSDEGMKGCSGQYAARNKATLVEASSSCSISKVLPEDMELQSPNVNGEMRDLRHVACCETSSNYINWRGHPPARKKPKRNQSFTSPFEIENQKTKSAILFSGLHLLADVAVRILENDVADFPENSLREENEITKAVFIPTGVPFLQKRVPAKSAFKHDQPYARQVLHDLEKSPSAAKSEPLLTAINICKLGDPECIKQSENEVVGNGVNEDPMAIPHVRRSKRTRSQALPSKYRDCVLQPWKRGTRR